MLAVGNDDQFRRLCRVLDAPDLAADARFATNAARIENYAALKPVLDTAIRGWTRRDLFEALNAAGVPVGERPDRRRNAADPQIAARDMIATLHHPTVGDLRVLGIR